MDYPVLKVPSVNRTMIDSFAGYNHNLRINDSEFFEMKNMTSDYYPVLSPRSGRSVYAKPLAPNGLIAKDSLCYVDGNEFVINEYRSYGLNLNDEPKQLISMGAYVIIMPDKKWINTIDHTFGNIEASFTAKTAATFTLCDISGNAFSDIRFRSPTEPKDPANGDYWMDTANEKHILKQYSSVSGAWVQITTTYINIHCEGIGAAFDKYDGVTISGITIDDLQDLNSSMVIWEKNDDNIVVVGLIDQEVTQPLPEEPGIVGIKVERIMPKMDFIVESENRLWGCHYGVANNGTVVNEIYASKLGDFKNWNCFMGLSTDSYAASVGTDGQFTGAITHMGYPLFFKENHLHKIYGNYPSNFQIQTTTCNGVEKGSHNSLAIVNSTLYYKGCSGVCVYDGSLPVVMSYALGNEAYTDAVGGSHGNKYYISMRDHEEKYHLFVYDAAKGMWHKEDDLKVEYFCSCRGNMYAIANGEIITMTGGSAADVDWMVETGEIGMYTPDMKYISRLTLRMSLDVGSEVRLYTEYDSDEEWHEVGTLTCTSLRSFSLPIRPKRCDHMRLRIEGVGAAKIYSITKTIEQGSEL